MDKRLIQSEVSKSEERTDADEDNSYNADDRRIESNFKQIEKGEKHGKMYHRKNCEYQPCCKETIDIMGFSSPGRVRIP